MGRAAKKIRKTEDRNAEPAYDVYIFHDPAKRPQGQDWERRHTTSNIQQAILRAEELHKTNDYPRVEIRKKYFDPKKERHMDRSVRIYGAQPERRGRRMVRVLKFVFSVMACYALASIIAHGGLL